MSETFLKDLYYDPKHGYVSLNKLVMKVKETHPEVTKKQVQDFLEKQYTYQVNKETKKPKVFNTILASAPRSNYQMDIIIYDRYEIHKYKYILCVIDVNSRFAQAVALTTRANKTIVSKLKNMFDKIGYPKDINCDNEFNTTELLKFFKDNKIIPHFSDVGDIQKNAIVERFNKTLAGLIQRWRVATKLRTWYKVLPDLIENYNTTFHSTIKAKPLDVFEGRDKNKQTNIVQYEPSYAVGDIVRIKQVKPILGKGDYIKYSEETYIITGTRGKRYYLKNTSTDETASRPYKDYEIKKATDIVTYEPPPDEGVRDVRPEETIAKERRTKKKVTEELQNIGDYLKAPKGKSWVREGKRKTKPTQKLDI